MSEPSAGPINFGRYRLLRKLATGGMAEIFLAVQQGLHGFEKVVVIKRVLPELNVSSEFVEMFLDEARLAARLDHSNIVRIYDFGEIDNQYYLAMEYLAGEDLASILQQCRRSQQYIPFNLAAEIMIGACEGLHFAHELENHNGEKLNIVHRDVSPSNILVTYQGVVKMVDFGIARAETNVVKTNPGTQLKGKIQYLAPEQAKGLPLDRRADTFALGIVLHELLTGKRLFQRENQLATLNAVLDPGEVIPAPSATRADIPPALDAIVLKALNRDPAGRYQSAAEFAGELGIFLMQQSHVRGTQVVPFLTKLFGEERRKSKLRVASGETSADDINRSQPGSQSRPSFSNLQPIRTDPNGTPRPKSQPRPGTPVGARPPSQVGGSRPPSQTGDARPPSQSAKPPPLPGPVPDTGPEPETSPESFPRSVAMKKYATIGAAAFGGLLVISAVALSLGSDKVEPVSNDEHKKNQVVVVPPKKDDTKVAVVDKDKAKDDDKGKGTPKDNAPGLQVGGVKFVVKPASAKVTIDGNPVGNPGQPQFLAVGTHKYEVDANGYFEAAAEITIEEGKVQEVNVALKPRPVTPKGTVEINCQPWCRISVDGRDTGKTSPARVVVNAGTRTLQLTNPPAGLAKTITLKVPENGTVKQVVKLED